MKSVLIFLVLLCACVHAEERLGVGSKAPPIDIEHWLNKEPVRGFEPGKVYIVEFWATWCGPCVAQMPHLAELQELYGDDLVVIGVGSEDPDTIEEFLDREHEGRTYREITDAYWLTTDPDGSVDRDYMKAADEHGIPTLFVVGKTGVIEWIGHPCNLRQPLAKIVAGTWDRRDFHDAKKLRVRSVPNLSIVKLSVGDRITVPVTGNDSGSLWGDTLYTLDSDPGAAAVHAGLLDVGETKTLEIWVVPSPDKYLSVDRNGVHSMEWGKYRAAFILRMANPVRDLKLNPDAPDDRVRDLKLHPDDRVRIWPMNPN